VEWIDGGGGGDDECSLYGLMAKRALERPKRR
jgi:hypothetical protein